MNVKIRSKDIPQEKKDAWEREKAGYLEELRRHDFEQLQCILTMRTICAAFLAADDQEIMSKAQVKRFVEGMMEIMSGESFDFLSRKEWARDGSDPVTDSMLCEMSRRGMYVNFKNVAGYHSLDEIARRLGKEFERSENVEAIDYRIGKEDAQG